MILYVKWQPFCPGGDELMWLLWIFYFVLDVQNFLRKHNSIFAYDILSFLCTEMAHVVEILPPGRQGSSYHAQFRSCWWHKETGYILAPFPWWHHQMETFSALLALCAGNSPVTGEFPTQRPVTWSFDVFFDLCLNKWLRKRLRHGWFETPSCSLWRHCNAVKFLSEWICVIREIMLHAYTHLIYIYINMLIWLIVLPLMRY